MSEVARNFIRANLYAVLVIGTFLGLIPIGLMAFAGEREVELGIGWRLLLVAVGLLGGSLSYTCMAVFVARGNGTAFPTDPPKRFVATGPYRYVRNPMYLGNLALGVGLAALVQSLTYFAYVAVLALVIHLYVSKHEEPRLRTRFGRSYVEYCEEVNRWLPRRKAVGTSGIAD